MIVLVILIYLITVGVILYPLWQRHAQSPGESEDLLEELRLQRDLGRSAMMELDLDYETGNLSSEDYRRLRQEHRDRTAAILKELDRQEQELERRIEAAVLRARRKRNLCCPSCGALFEKEARLCSQCGARLGGEAC
jgi:rubrerythrin